MTKCVSDSNSDGTDDGAGNCNCITDYEWSSEECRLSKCVNDPNSDGTDDGSDNCNCNSGFLWNGMIETCTLDCTGDANADGNAGPTAD